MRKTMQIDMPYGKNAITLPLSEKLDYTVLDSSNKRSAALSAYKRYGLDERELVEKALNKPVQSGNANGRYNFNSFFKPEDTVAVVISDYTRATGSEIYTPIIISKLEKMGIKLKHIIIVIALGLHRPASRDEMIKLVTEDVYNKVKIINHNPNDGLIKIGSIRVNRAVAEAYKVVITGCVNFHPMAGFSGGYKSIIPGVASKNDILRNHKLYFQGLNANPLIEPGKVYGNPILTDLINR